MKSIIVAYDRNRGIGASGDLLWKRDLPADLRHFKDITTGFTIIMGRKTYESIGRPLPHRQTIVMSHTMAPTPDVVIVGSLKEAYAAATTDDIFVIGGGQVFEMALPTVEEIVATEVNSIFPNADVFFPALDGDIWQETARESHKKDATNLYDYDFVTYRRR